VRRVFKVYAAFLSDLVEATPGLELRDRAVRG